MIYIAILDIAMNLQVVSSIEKYFSFITDPRINRRKYHQLKDIFLSRYVDQLVAQIIG
jgi:hypothetical protein